MKKKVLSLVLLFVATSMILIQRSAEELKTPEFLEEATVENVLEKDDALEKVPSNDAVVLNE